VLKLILEVGMLLVNAGHIFKNKVLKPYATLFMPLILIALP